MVDLFLLTTLAKWLLSLSEFDPVVWKVHLSCIVNSHSTYQTAKPEVVAANAAANATEQLS